MYHHHSRRAGFAAPSLLHYALNRVAYLGVVVVTRSTKDSRQLTERREAFGDC